jgi:O-antigen ligase
MSQLSGDSAPAEATIESQTLSPWGDRLERGIEFLLCAFALLLVVNRLHGLADSLALLALVVAVVRAFLPGARRSLPRTTKLLVLLFAVFAITNLVSWRLAPEMQGRGGFHYAKFHVTGAALVLAAALGLRRTESIKRVLVVLLLAAGCWYLGEAVSIPWRQPFLNGRLAGARGYHTLLASELVILVALFLGWSLAGASKPWRFAAFGGALLLSVLLVMTNTRGAMLALVLVAIPATAVLQRRLGGLRRRLMLVGLWLLVLVPAAGFTWYRLADPGRRSPETVSARWTAYRISWQIFSRAPLAQKVFGHGPTNRVFSEAALHYGTDSPVQVGQTLKHAHNNVLQTLVETGLLGVASLAAVWGLAAAAAWRVWRRQDLQAAPLAGVLLGASLVVAAAGMYNFTLWQVPGGLSWLVVGLSAALASAAEQNSGVRQGCLDSPSPA